MVTGMAAEIIDSKIYFSKQQKNGLYSYDIYTNKVSFVKYFVAEKNEEILYAHAYRYNRKLFFTPWNATKIAVFDVDKNIIRYINIPNSIGLYNTTKRGNSLFFCSIDKPEYFVLNMKTEEIEVYKKEDISELNYCHKCCSMMDDKVLIMPGKNRQQYYIDIESGNLNKIELPFKVDDYFQCLLGNDKYIYIPKYLEEGIVIYDNKNNIHKKIMIDEIEDQEACVVSVLINNELILFPLLGSNIYIINLENQDVEKISLRKTFSLEVEDMGFQNIIYDDHIYYITSDRNPFILRMDMDKSFEIMIMNYENNDFKKKIEEIKASINGEMLQNNSRRIKYEGIDELEDLIIDIYAIN